MKINLLRILLVILLLGTCYIIFGFSSQDGEESGGISQKVTSFILEKSNTYNELETTKKEEVFAKTEKIIRKIAHFSIYTLVGFLLMALASTFKLKENNRFLISLFLGIIYAISDEIHQSFIPGRSPLLTDVFLDTLGVLLGILVIMLIIKIYQKYKENTAKTHYENITE